MGSTDDVSVIGVADPGGDVESDKVAVLGRLLWMMSHEALLGREVIKGFLEEVFDDRNIFFE